MARIIADFGQQLVSQGGRSLTLSVFGMDCGCTIEVDLRGYLASNTPLRDLLERTAYDHRCDVVVRPKPYETASQRRPERIPWSPYDPSRESLTYMGVPISSPERALREFYAEVRAPARPSTNPLGFKPEQLDALKAKITEPVKVKEIKPDRFDLIEID